MVEAYVSGVSQRKMGDVTEALLGERVGRPGREAARWGCRGGPGGLVLWIPQLHS